MPRTRRSYAPSLKAKVAIEAIKGNKTTTQFAQTFVGVHPNLVAFWKKQAIDHLIIWRRFSRPVRPDSTPVSLAEDIFI